MLYTLCRLYTLEFYKANENAILTSASVGVVGEHIDIDNYTYMSIKTGAYGTTLEAPNDMNEAQVQADLDSLRAGVFESYQLSVSQYHTISEMQRTAGDSEDHVTFERFVDPVYGGRWRLILSNRDSVDAFSIKVYDNNGSYLYTPGSFIDQGDGTWMVESNYIEYDDGDVNFDFILGSASITEVYHIDKIIQKADWDIAYFTAE